METTPEPWTVHEGRDPEKELRSLRSRFAAIRNRADRRARLLRFVPFSAWHFLDCCGVPFRCAIRSAMCWLSHAVMRRGPWAWRPLVAARPAIGRTWTATKMASPASPGTINAFGIVCDAA